MKNLAIVVALIMLSVSSVQAQDATGKGRGGKHGMKHRGDPAAHLTEKLNLSDEQAAEVEIIFAESRAQHQAIQASVEDEHCAVRAETMDELATVLTDEQMAQFDQMQSKRKNQDRQHGMPRFANCDI